MSSARYTPEFKDEAVRQVVDRGHSVPVSLIRTRFSVVFGLTGQVSIEKRGVADGQRPAPIASELKC